VAQTTVESPLVNLLQQAQNAVDQSKWSEAITQLQELRQSDAVFETGRVASLFCDAYVGRGLDTLNNITSDMTTHVVVMTTALNDFEAGAKECPRRTDLRDQANRAAAYLKSLNAEPTDYDTLIQDLNPIVAAEPNYANGGAKQLLYNAYLARGDSWRDQKQQVKALGDYQAAIDLNVPDPLEARSRQAEILIGGQKPTDTPQPKATNTPRPGSTATTPPKLTPTVAAVLPTPITLKEPPQLVTPNDSSFSGMLTEVYLEWQPVQLADDEYYNLTITYIFGQEIKYWGTATRETKIRIPTDIGVGKAGNDRFSWWVTIRKKNSAATPGGTDLATSKDSEVHSFVWTGS
jgi:tetratricopeptide (TPR) repeat protein